MNIQFDSKTPNFALLEAVIHHLAQQESLHAAISHVNVVDELNIVDIYLDNGTKMKWGYEESEGAYVFSQRAETQYEKSELPYSEEVVRNMAKELSSKSKLLKKFKKKWRKAYSIGSLERILARKKTYEIDPMNYQGWDDFDDEGFLTDNRISIYKYT